MNVVGFILLGSMFALSAAGLIGLRWARRTGQLARTDRAALLPFDEAEPEGVMTDLVLGVRASARGAIQSRTGAVQWNSQA